MGKIIKELDSFSHNVIPAKKNIRLVKNTNKGGIII